MKKLFALAVAGLLALPAMGAGFKLELPNMNFKIDKKQVQKATRSQLNGEPNRRRKGKNSVYPIFPGWERFICSQGGDHKFSAWHCRDESEKLTKPGEKCVKICAICQKCNDALWCT